MREYWLDPPEPLEPIECPICQDECSEFFFDVNGYIVGCDSCITSRDAYEYLAEREELEKDYYDETRFSDK